MYLNLLQPSEGLLFWQSLTFLIVLLVLAKFVWKPIMAAIKKREDSISDALSAAEKAKEEMAQLSADNEKLLADARLERDNIIKEAKAASDKMVTEAKAVAETEAKALIEKAQATIAGERKAAIAEIREQAANLSVEIAEKLLRRELQDKAAQEELLNKFMDEANLTVA